MNMVRLTPADLEPFRRISTCIVASAIETFGVRLANAGFASSSLQCIFEDLPATVGYAATARVRSAVPPMEGHDFYYDRTDWWNHILATPEPRVVVMEDVDRPPGRGAFVGEVNANILMALGCAGLVTNGAVRDLNEVQQTGFQMFAGNVAVSHAYAHVFDFGGAVEVAGLQIRPGDLIQGDRHGVQIIPLEIAGKIPAVAHQIMRRRQHLIGLCRSTEFSVEKLRQAFKEPAHK